MRHWDGNESSCSDLDSLEELRPSPKPARGAKTSMAGKVIEDKHVVSICFNICFLAGLMITWINCCWEQVAKWIGSELVHDSSGDTLVATSLEATEELLAESRALRCELTGLLHAAEGL